MRGRPIIYPVGPVYYCTDHPYNTISLCQYYIRSHHAYFIGYAATTGVIIYWNTEIPYYIHRYHNFFYEYNYCLSTEYNKTTIYLLTHQ